MPSPQHPATLSTTASTAPSVHRSQGGIRAGHLEPAASLRTFRTGSAQIGQLSVNGPMGL
jgi:hypothetical protein